MLRELRVQVMQKLQEIPMISEDYTIAIATLLRTPEQAQEMMDYLEKIDLKATKMTPIINKALELNKKN
jgi:hypothetical protein